MHDDMNNNVCENGFGAASRSILPNFEYEENLMNMSCF